MTPAEFAQLRQLFDELHGIPAGLRAPRLESVDPSLRDQLVQLLALAQGSSVDAQLPTQVDLNDPAPPRAAIAAGTAIGPYRLVDSLGRGGMGVVYRARHERSGQEVAIKLVRPERATPDLLRRFEFEMRVLARLEHPSIARILHAGTVVLDGEPCPYLALELVRGVQLLEYSQQRRLGLRARLDLFARVVDAVQYAHGQGVIHRDLKPANIFVNSDGLPKVLDFGIARIIAADCPQTLLTAPGELVGTPTHMSPEQLKGDPAQIDIRTDVYSLGVILYELITGEWPYGHRNLPLPQLARVILEDEPRPPRALAPRIDREIELITLRALEKEPARRYQTADALSLDLRRYLRHEPIEARSPTAGYLLRKFYRRNRILCLGAASTMLALIIGLGGTTYGFWQQSRERARAEKAVHLREEFEEMLDNVLLRVQSPELKVAEVAQALAAELNQRSADPETQAYLLSRVGSFLLGAGDYEGARAALTRAWPLINSVPGLSELQVPVAMSLARLCFEADADFVAAEKYLVIALASREGGTGGGSAHRWQQLGGTYAEADRLEEARSLLLKAMAECRDAAQQGEIYNDLGYVDVLMGEYVEAEAYYRAALRLDQHTTPYDAVAAATTEGNLAMALAYQGLCDEAETVVQKAYQAQLAANGPDHRATLAAKAYRAFVAACRGDLQRAVEGYQAVLNGQEKWFGDKPHPAKAFTKIALAAVLAECGATESAEALRAAGEADYAEVLGRPHRTALWFYYGLRGQRCERRGELAAAESAYSDGVPAFEALGPAGGSFAALCRLGLARVKSMSDVTGVAALAEGAVGELERIHGGKSPLLASASVDLGLIRARAGDTEGACDAWQRAITIRAEGPDIAAWTAAGVHWQVTNRAAGGEVDTECAFAGRALRGFLLEVLPESDQRRVFLASFR